MTGEKTSPASRATKVLIGLGVAVTAALLVLIVTSQLPTFVGGLSTEHPAFEDRSRRRPSSGPGLGQPVNDVQEEEVTFPSRIGERGVARLKGTLSLPALPGPRPAVILLHGSGPSSRDAELPGDLVSRVSPPFPFLRAMADFFAHEGLVVLRWDKRTPQFYPELAGHLREFRFSDYETDARDAIAYLTTRPEVNPDAIVVAGHSEGGGIAPHVAAAEPRVVATVMLAAFPEPFDGGAWQVRHHAATRLRQGDVFGYFALLGMARKAEGCLNRLETAYQANELCIPGAPQFVVKDMVDYGSRTATALRELRTPIFAIQGSVDRNIDPETIQRLGRQLADHDIELHYVPKLNHLLVDVVDGKGPPAISEEVKRRLRVFLASVGAPASR